MKRHRAPTCLTIQTLCRTIVAGLVVLGGVSTAWTASGDRSAQKAASDEPTLVYKNDVAAAGQAWLDGLGSQGLTIVANGLTGLYETKTTTPLPAYIRSSDRPWLATLGFAEPITSSMTVDEVQRHLRFFAHSGFPTPGLSKQHWQIEAQTPSSSISEGLTVLAVGPGLLKLEIKTRFFALYGRDMRAVPAADAPLREDSYFQIRQSFSGTAIITFRVENF